MDGYLIPADRMRHFITAALEPWAGLYTDCSVPKAWPLVEVVICLYMASLVRNAESSLRNVKRDTKQ